MSAAAKSQPNDEQAQIKLKISELDTQIEQLKKQIEEK